MSKEDANLRSLHAMAGYASIPDLTPAPPNGNIRPFPVIRPSADTPARPDVPEWSYAAPQGRASRYRLRPTRASSGGSSTLISIVSRASPINVALSIALDPFAVL